MAVAFAESPWQQEWACEYYRSDESRKTQGQAKFDMDGVGRDTGLVPWRYFPLRSSKERSIGNKLGSMAYPVTKNLSSLV